jgi:hypothetical protein
MVDEPYKPTDEECDAIWREIKYVERLQEMSTREFIGVLLNEVWARIPLGSKQSSIVDVAIRRLRVVAAREIREERRKRRETWPDELREV